MYDFEKCTLRLLCFGEFCLNAYLTDFYSFKNRFAIFKYKNQLMSFSMVFIRFRCVLPFAGLVYPPIPFKECIK